MPLNVKNDDAHRLAKELAELTGNFHHGGRHDRVAGRRPPSARPPPRVVRPPRVGSGGNCHPLCLPPYPGWALGRGDSGL